MDGRGTIRVKEGSMRMNKKKANEGEKSEERHG